MTIKEFMHNGFALDAAGKCVIMDNDNTHFAFNDIHSTTITLQKVEHCDPGYDYDLAVWEGHQIPYDDFINKTVHGFIYNENTKQWWIYIDKTVGD